MNDPIQPTKAVSSARHLVGRSPLRRGFLPIALASLALAGFALSPPAQAFCQDGCLNNGNTRQGENTLFSLTTGSSNTAIGADALYSNTTGDQNTASGVLALFSNTTGFYNTATGFQAL